MTTEDQILDIYETNIVCTISSLLERDAKVLKTRFKSLSDKFIREVKSVPRKKAEILSYSLMESDNCLNSLFNDTARAIDYETHLRIVEAVNTCLVNLEPLVNEVLGEPTHAIFKDERLLNIDFLSSLDLKLSKLNKREGFFFIENIRWNSVYIDTSSQSVPKQLSLGFKIELTKGCQNLLNLHLQHYSFLSGFLSTRDPSLTRSVLEKTSIEKVSIYLSVLYLKKFCNSISAV